MISFIVIGKNEGWKLKLCFNSIIETTKYNNIKSYEIIYVDSKSTDKSISLAKSYNGLKTILLTEDCNPAIARNCGSKEAKGDVLLFLDGDMELLPKEFGKYYTENLGIEHPFLSGNWINYNYDQNWNLVKVDEKPYLKLKKDIYTSELGGIFFIERELWRNSRGMKNFMFRGEDPDLGLRLANKGTLLLRKNNILAKHHTIPYLDKKRKWERIFNKTHLFGRTLVYRENLLNKYCWLRIVRKDLSMLILALSIIASAGIYEFSFMFYFGVILLRVIRNKKAFIENFVLFFIQDILVLSGFLFFFPRKVSVSSIRVDN